MNHFNRVTVVDDDGIVHCPFHDDEVVFHRYLSRVEIKLGEERSNRQRADELERIAIACDCQDSEGTLGLAVGARFEKLGGHTLKTVEGEAVLPEGLRASTSVEKLCVVSCAMRAWTRHSAPPVTNGTWVSQTTILRMDVMQLWAG